MKQKFGERAFEQGLRRRELGLLFVTGFMSGVLAAALVLMLT